MRTLLRENIDGFKLASVRTSFLKLLTGEFKTKEKVLCSFCNLPPLFRLGYCSLFNSHNSLYCNNLSSDHSMDSLRLRTKDWLFIFVQLASGSQDNKHNHLTTSKGREVKILISFRIWFICSDLRREYRLQWLIVIRTTTVICKKPSFVLLSGAELHWMEYFCNPGPFSELWL